MALTERQRRFAEEYAIDPNATAAARRAGYSERTARAQGQRLLTNIDIQRHIQQLQDEAAGGRIATMTQTKAFWSSVMLDPAERTVDRLRASELLAKAAGAFLHLRPDPDGGGIIAAGEVDGSDVVVFVPQMLSEAECQVQEVDIP